MEALIRYLYFNPFFSRFFHTSVYCLKRELSGCNTVLDLGCGSDSPLKYCKVRYSVGVDAFETYINDSKKRRIHSKYILGDIAKLQFRPKCFDAVIMIGVLEHLNKSTGKLLLSIAEKWAIKKIIVSCPNGFLPQKTIDGNLYQQHKSGWTVDEMELRGYKVYGMTGIKFLRRENSSKETKQKDDIFTTIRFKPRNMWLIISELTQLITYYFPRLSFEIFCMKKLKNN